MAHFYHPGVDEPPSESAVKDSQVPRGNGLSAFGITHGDRVIDSTPAPMKTSPSPARIGAVPLCHRLQPGGAETVYRASRGLVRKPGQEQGHASNIAVVFPGLVTQPM